MAVPRAGDHRDDLGVRKRTTRRSDHRVGHRGSDACPTEQDGVHPMFYLHKDPACQAVETNISVGTDNPQLFEAT